MAVIRTWLLVGFVACGVMPWVALALPAWGVAVVAALFLVGLAGLGLSLPLLALSTHLRAERRGGTTLRSERPLEHQDSRELYRVVDLVRGRLGRVLPRLDEGRCEVWLCPSRRWRRTLMNARLMGVGLVGPAVCPVLVTDLGNHEQLLHALSEGLAANAAWGLRGRLRGFALEGLTEWLTACGEVPEGTERRLLLHRAASALDGGGLPVYSLLLGESPGGERRALARSFTAFLIGRYGTRAYLRFLRHADRRPPHIALLLAYQRTPAELERHWRSFLAASAPLGEEG
jgi:hypothetical protein